MSPAVQTFTHEELLALSLLSIAEAERAGRIGRLRLQRLWQEAGIERTPHKGGIEARPKPEIPLGLYPGTPSPLKCHHGGCCECVWLAECQDREQRGYQLIGEGIIDEGDYRTWKYRPRGEL